MREFEYENKAKQGKKETRQPSSYYEQRAVAIKHVQTNHPLVMIFVEEKRTC